MKYETIRDLRIPKIGFGTWKIGGGDDPDYSLDAKSLAALDSALELGYTHFDTAEEYANGHAEELIGQAIHGSGVKRENLFITSKVKPEHLHYEDLLRSFENSLRHLGMDYIDAYLIHWPNPAIPMKETFRALNQLVRQGRVRHIGVSNFKRQTLKRAQAESETPLLMDQVPYRLSKRAYVKNGILSYCQQNDILVAAYSPIKIRNLRNNPTLNKIAEAHSATPHQIALAWLVNQPRVVTIPMSFDRKHQKENLEAADIELTAAEIARLDRSY